MTVLIKRRGINLGSKTNQIFIQISFGSLRKQLENLCSRYDIQYVEQEESYTSKASFLNLDFADVNGSANILRKSSRDFDFEELRGGLFASPLRIKLA